MEMEQDHGKELFYAAERGDVTRCRQLLENGAEVDWRAGSEYWFRTPLMQAAKGGRTDVCQLLLNSGAQVNAFTLNHWTALMLAARYGQLETCQLLIGRGADVNNQTKDNKENALMWAAGNGHPDVCRLLIDNKAQVNTQDSLGITALMRAAKEGRFEACNVLLRSGAQTEAETRLGNQLIDAERWAKHNRHPRVVHMIKSFKVNRSLASEGTEPPSQVTLCTCGAVNAGKTTILENLQKGYIQRKRASSKEQPNTSEDMSARTAGIEVGVIHIPGVGDFRKMDMAGHSWAFTINDFFLGKQCSISLVLFDLTKSDEEINNELVYHLGLLKAKENRKDFFHRLEVVLVATHSDKCTNAHVRAEKFYRSMRHEYEAFLNFYVDVMVVNCCDPESFVALKESLKELRQKIIKISDRVPKLCCQLIHHIRTWASERLSFPVMHWEEFLEKVKEVNPAITSELLRNVVYYLSETGEVVNDDSPELRDKLILNVNWLTHDVFGIALAPTNFPRTLRCDKVNGLVSRDEICSTFPQVPANQLLELFLRFEICLSLDETAALNGDTFLFPSHLETKFENLDHVWPQFDKQSELCVTGRILECKTRTDIFPSSYFSRLQIRLLKRFSHKSPVWFGGVKLVDDVIELLVTQSQDLRAINICVWAPKGCEERCYKALLYVESIRDRLIEEICTGTETIYKVLSTRMLRHMKYVGYLVDEVQAALRLHGPAARVTLPECGVSDNALDIMYCGLRRFLYPINHVSHLTLRQRRQLSALLDSGYSEGSYLTRLSSQLGVDVGTIHQESIGHVPVFGSLIPGSYSDRLLAAWGESYNHTQNELARALEKVGCPKVAVMFNCYRLPSENSENAATETNDESSATHTPQIVSRLDLPSQEQWSKTELPCTRCGHCSLGYPAKETGEDFKLPFSTEETAEKAKNIVVEETELPVSEQETVTVSKERLSECPGSLSHDVTEASLRLSSELLSVLSERLGLSWIDLARELSFSECEILEFEADGLVRMQALRMLEAWLVIRTRDCRTCDHCLLSELSNGLKNIYRGELVNFLRSCCPVTGL